MKNEKLSKTLKIATFVIIILGGIFVFENINSIKDFIQTNRELAWLVYILSWVILPIFFFPVPVLALVGGVVFDFYLSVVLTTFGATINMILMFYIGKFLKFGKFSPKIKDSFIDILILRFIPFMPYNLLNYGCGFLNVSFKNYILASFLGVLPATFILLNLGQNATKFGTSQFYWSIFWFVLLVIFSLLFKKLFSPKNSDKTGKI
ncbi:TVP38/TMEM64 family protein [Campylobacter geochelonis]|uniref:TVP38/TMEM64 family protein n=1 Tax=Campylobacter geochelonis TaxID=1780362 RepID=UPI0007708101|nr:VTT domain-containing protein [Campylobacter geochelonis]CZE46685.1 TVP38/TMEM64 family inner membrane protein ydjZ [Campylobacter geochelonis]CZE50354.1 TVP38/TMEM64 family inner membrane protein ydjZ [Campylobacter geochelonis]